MPAIRKIFEYIEQDSISPAERAQMFDEHGQELLDEETRKESKLELARNLLSIGLSREQIVQATGLSIQEIQALMKDV